MFRVGAVETICFEAVIREVAGLLFVYSFVVVSGYFMTVVCAVEEVLYVVRSLDARVVCSFVSLRSLEDSVTNRSLS